MNSVDCSMCEKEMTLTVKPRERRTPLSENERPTMIPHTFDEWVCSNGHRRDLTYTESRMFE